MYCSTEDTSLRNFYIMILDAIEVRKFSVKFKRKEHTSFVSFHEVAGIIAKAGTILALHCFWTQSEINNRDI